MKKLFISLFFIFFTNQLLAIRDIDQQLIDAAAEGDLQNVNLLLDLGANVNAQDDDGSTPLVWSIWKRHTVIIDRLLEVPKIDINAKDNSCFTALMLAITEGDLNTINKLLKFHNIDVNAQDCNGHTALMWAAAKASSRTDFLIVKELLQVPNINIYLQDYNNKTALDMAALKPKSNLIAHAIANAIIDSKHFDLDKFLETIPQYNRFEWSEYINKQKELIVEEKLHKLVQKHGSITNYLQQRELGKIKYKSLS